jgi:dihydroneopterin aldolase
VQIRNDNSVQSDILAARCYAPDERLVEAVLDRVTVRDVVVDCNIGVYSLERGVTQRVRIGVEIDIAPPAHPLDEDIANVISYDYVLDGIRAIIGAGHIALVETLAERIAEHCLKDQRAISVRVTVEKLDRVPGAALGVEIVRRIKAAEEFNVYAMLRRASNRDLAVTGLPCA